MGGQNILYIPLLEYTLSTMDPVRDRGRDGKNNNMIKAIFIHITYTGIAVTATCL